MSARFDGTGKDSLVVPDGMKWKFDGMVAGVFDDMLSRSIPDYAGMRRLVSDIGMRFLPKDGTLLDLGCSLGGSFAPFVGKCTRIVGVEASRPMAEEAGKRHKGEPGVEILEQDFVREFPDVPADLVLSVLTLQFTPIEHRQRILSDVRSHVRHGGAFILVEKVLGCDLRMDALFTDVYYGMKAGNAYTQEQIASKRKSLEGVLVPVQASWNEQLLRGAGFTTVECFWRSLQFCAWLALP